MGAGLGGTSRYVLGLLFGQPIWLPFALSTFAVNLIGGFIAGVLMAGLGLPYLKNHLIGLFLMTGFLGGLTTFSAFTLEGAVLLGEKPSIALLQMVAHVLGCLIAFGAGYKLMTMLQ